MRQYEFLEPPSLEALLPVFPTPDWSAVVELDRSIQSWCEDCEGQKMQPGSQLSNLRSVENGETAQQLFTSGCKLQIPYWLVKKEEM